VRQGHKEGVRERHECEQISEMLSRNSMIVVDLTLHLEGGKKGGREGGREGEGGREEGGSEEEEWKGEGEGTHDCPHLSCLLTVP